MTQASEQFESIKGCPSKLEDTYISQTDPYCGDVDLTTYETTPKPGVKALELSLQGVHCAGCVSKIETGLASLNGIEEARVNLTTARLNVAWLTELQSSKQIISTVTNLGFGVTPFIHSDVEIKQKDESKRLLRYIAVSAFAAMNVMLLSISVWSGGDEMSLKTRHLFHWISALIAFPTVVYAGRAFFIPAFQALKKKQTNMDVPISLALILACGLSLYETIMGNQDIYFDAAVMLLFLLLIGRYLDTRLRLKTGEAARRLTSMQVTTATRLLPDGTQETLPAQALDIGDHILIPKGQRIPIDSQITEGHSEIDVQIATGETQYQQVKIGDTLLSGTVNIGHPLKARVISNLGNSFLSEITKLVEIGEQTKSRFVRIADIAARAYVPIVHTLAFLTFLGWYLYSGDLRMAALNAIAVLIITCPCALGLAVPAVHAVAAGKLFEKGIYARSGDALERLAMIDHVIFDKTGTLTKGQFTLVTPELYAFNTLGLAGALAANSTHPLSQSLKIYAMSHDISHIREISGEGLEAIFAGDILKLGSAKFIGLNPEQNETSSVWFKQGEKSAIKFNFQDQLREDAEVTIKRLDEMSITQEMLTGDNPEMAKIIAKQVGLKHWQANVSPKEKMQTVQERILKQKHPLMVGDGINDAPALALADVGFAIGTGTDVAIESADITLMRGSLHGLADAIAVSKATLRNIKQNLFGAFVYNVAGIPFAAGILYPFFGILLSPVIAGAAMAFSSLTVVSNANRLRLFKAKEH